MTSFNKLLMETKIWASSQTTYITLNKGHPHPPFSRLYLQLLKKKKVAFNHCQEFLFVTCLINTQQKKH